MRCYERDFIVSLSGNYQTDIIEAFISTSRYLDLLNIDNPFSELMVPTELQLSKVNCSDTYIHTYMLSIRKVHRHTCVSARMYARMHGYIRANIQTSKLEVRS